MNKTSRRFVHYSIIATAFVLAGSLAPSSFAEKKVIPVEVKNKRNKPVIVRNSIIRHPVYCVRTVGTEHLTPYEINCYKSLTRDRIETIPNGYSLVITDILITNNNHTSNHNERFNIAFGRMSEAEHSIVAPGILIRARADNTIQKSFQTSPLIFHTGERFAGLNNGEFLVLASASGYLAKTSNLKHLF